MTCPTSSVPVQYAVDRFEPKFRHDQPPAHKTQACPKALTRLRGAENRMRSIQPTVLQTPLRCRLRHESCYRSVPIDCIKPVIGSDWTGAHAPVARTGAASRYSSSLVHTSSAASTKCLVVPSFDRFGRSYAARLALTARTPADSVYTAGSNIRTWPHP